MFKDVDVSNMLFSAVYFSLILLNTCFMKASEYA